MIDHQNKLNRHLSFLAQDENNLALLVEISDLYLASGDLEAAQKFLHKANAIDRKACLAHQGLLYLHQGHFIKAKESFLEALEHTDTPALHFNLGFACFMNMDLEEAFDVLSAIIDEEYFSEARLLMARILHKQDDIEKALNLLENILADNPDNAEALGLLALLYFDLNNEELAYQTCTRALQLNPQNYDALIVKVLTGLVTQETSVEEIENLLQINPHNPHLWFALGTTHMHQGNFDLSESTLKKAVDIYPQFYDCHITLGWCQLLNNHPNAALKTYQTAAEIDANLADSWGGLALVYVLKEDFLKAEQFIEKANKINPDCFLTEIAQSIYFNHKNPVKAKKHLMKALKNSKVSVSEKLAFILEEMDKNDQLH